MNARGWSDGVGGMGDIRTKECIGEVKNKIGRDMGVKEREESVGKKRRRNR